MNGAIYLIPVPLGDTEIDKVLPSYNREIISNIKHFVVEDIRSARRFLKKSNRDIIIDDLSFYLLNEHSNIDDIKGVLDVTSKGLNIGVISEAGCPAVADPGADIVALAQKRNIKVVPLVGPSSILMGLMGSGFNGQRFTFNGYIPIDAAERTRYIKLMENRIYKDDNTQIFIETPYRNNKLLNDILNNCQPNTKLCIAANISNKDEYIVTKTVAQWKGKLPDINKVPTIFLLYK